MTETELTPESDGTTMNFDLMDKVNAARVAANLRGMILIHRATVKFGDVKAVYTSECGMMRIGRRPEHSSDFYLTVEDKPDLFVNCPLCIEAIQKKAAS